MTEAAERSGTSSGRVVIEEMIAIVHENENRTILIFVPFKRKLRTVFPDGAG